ncbi:enoyl-CoA hydratase/isomerase family protein [Sphingobium subterraneum]|uniref:2-(1,2-epoxy-1,2-dihydrophenyl)acetyl-CoA isomerase n=1 Tax=Sphingobium subterraneum TaxID=627688 RepID=A0A841JAX5_9SPHN|nr:enoyl-CoA hydratase/isomerase family protein [Sphingobium subterraneum]MBB6125281.1 2-(1,2-epoxy-1,2-dihydrophenyl)acetyl-CoA isomerase [Sphingobium subterraneum]
MILESPLPPPILHDVRDGVGTITLNRPEKRNAMMPEMFALFNAAMRAHQSNPDVRAIQIMAEGPAFCAGGDLQMIDKANLGEVDADTLDLDFFIPGTVTKPIVCGAIGPCVGEGVAMMLASDIVICGRSARFALPEVGLGIAPVDIPLLAARRLGANHILEALLSGDWMGPDWAEKVGLVNRVVDDGNVAQEVSALARKIAGSPAPVVALVKSLVYEARASVDPAALRASGAERRSRLRRGLQG